MLRTRVSLYVGASAQSLSISSAVGPNLTITLDPNFLTCTLASRADADGVIAYGPYVAPGVDAGPAQAQAQAQAQALPSSGPNEPSPPKRPHMGAPLMHAPRGPLHVSRGPLPPEAPQNMSSLN